MGSIVVSSSFWHNPIVQVLRMVVPKEVWFRESSNISCHILFPSFGGIAYYIMDASDLNDTGVAVANKMCTEFNTLVIIILLGMKDRNAYGDFVSKVSLKVNAVVCFPVNKCEKSVADFIWKTASDLKPSSRKLQQMVDKERTLANDPDYQANRIFKLFIQDEKERDGLLEMMKTETGTIRKTLVEGIPEALENDFYLEPKNE